MQRIIAIGAAFAIVALVVIAVLVASGASLVFVAGAIVALALIASGTWGLRRNPRWRE